MAFFREVPGAVKLILVRHGETPSNRDRLALGRAEPALSELGQEQARAAGRALADSPDASRVAAVLTSPQLRARQTAEAIAAALGVEPLSVHEGLIEMDVGDADGLTGREMQERFPEFLRDWFGEGAGELKMPGGGESLADVQRRAWAVVEALREAHEPDEVVIAVTHNFVIRTLVCRALEIPLYDFRRFQQDLAAITAIDFRGARTLVSKLNETCHLEGLLTPQPPFWR
jgi:ribonuclease H / adenosylcobalamin/alpha-ribazole phosphatase